MFAPAYGFNNLPADAQGTPRIGPGQTIAIVDAYDDPNVFTDLDSFDQQFSATPGGPTLFAQFGAASTFLTVFNQNGKTSPLPGTDPSAFPNDWEFEESLDVQWAHSIAPGAKLDLVEANSNSDADLTQAAVASAASLPGVSVVSMSFGGPEDASFDPGANSIFVKAGVTFCASTGDNGSGNNGSNAGYPSYSPNVVAVGGTSLTINSDGSYGGETGWSGSGGGTSTVEAEPAYQQGAQSTGQRTVPDVAFLADPNTGVDVVDTFGNSGDPLQQVGGTSLACPMWAATIATANQGRVSAGLSTLNTGGPTETQTALYGLPSADFNDITSGNNGGFNAGPGYDEVTGIGTPIPNKLIPGLIGGSSGGGGGGIGLAQNYAGLNEGQSGGFVPPDSQGAAGTVSFVETANQELALFPDKTTSVGEITDSFSDFWLTQGGLIEPTGGVRGFSDPIVVWDDQIDRFIVGDQDIDTNDGDTGAFFIAVSKSDAPATLTSADWNFYSITTTESGLFGDYPGNFGYNHDAFVFTLNMFSGTAPDLNTPDSSGISHVQVNAISIQDLVNGVSQANLHAFQTDTPANIPAASLRPTVMHDSVAGDPMWFVQQHLDANGDPDGANIDVVKMTNVLSASPTYTATTLAVNAYTPVGTLDVNGNPLGVPLQPDGSAVTTNIDSRIMKVAEWNNVLVASHSVTDATGDRDLGAMVPDRREHGDAHPIGSGRRERRHKRGRAGQRL